MEPPRTPPRAPQGLAPWLRATLVASLTLLGATLLAFLLTESEASAAAARVGASRVARETPPVSQRALSLDGRSALGFIDDIAFLGREKAYTLECWARGPAPKRKHTLIGNRHYGGAGISWSHVEGFPSRPTGWVNMSEVPGVRQTGYALLRAVDVGPHDDWTHIALVVDRQLARLFVNGRSRAEAIVGGRIRRGRSPFYVGADTTGKGTAEQFFRGELDDVRISVVARYREEFVPPRTLTADTHTTLLLDFEDAEEPFRDRSARRLRPQIIGAPQAVPTMR